MGQSWLVNRKGVHSICCYLQDKKAVIDLAEIAVTMTYTTVNMETFSPFMRQ